VIDKKNKLLVNVVLACKTFFAVEDLNKSFNSENLYLSANKSLTKLIAVNNHKKQVIS